MSIDLKKITRYINSAKRTIELEKDAISQLYNSIDNHFAQACQLLLECKGRIIVTGIGKSGHIGRKVAATLSSTGSPAFFVHAGEASHGDLGMIANDDIVLALSYSGKTCELIALLPILKRVGIKLISITGDQSSQLAISSNVHLHISVDKEACPLGLAPTSSTTAALVMGDSLAIALLEAKGFTREDFAFSHPAGNLGNKLLLVDDIMHKNERLPIIASGAPLNNALIEMSSKGLGMTAICNTNGVMIGIFTDGDLRRTIDSGLDPRKISVDQVMTCDCITIKAGILAAEALKIMQMHKINGLYCTDEHGHPIGAFNMQNLLDSGIV